MPSTHVSLHYHIVFSTKDRQPWIAREWRDDLHRYLGGCARTLDAKPHEIGGTDDHVHLLLGLTPVHRLADIIREIKKVSSRWVHEKTPAFAWQEGYGGFTVSESNVDAVRRYIARQEEHHRKRPFKDEYRELLQRHAVDFDECYLW